MNCLDDVECLPRMPAWSSLPPRRGLLTSQFQGLYLRRAATPCGGEAHRWPAHRKPACSDARLPYSEPFSEVTASQKPTIDLAAFEPAATPPA